MLASKSRAYKLFYTAAFLFAVLFVFVTLKENHNAAGWMLALFFAALAIAFRGNKFLKGLSYTVMIMAVVSIAMYHPRYFITVGNFKLSSLIIPLLQVIMFGMGTELSLKDFANVIRMPKGIIIGVVGHYIIMLLVGFTVAY